MADTPISGLNAISGAAATAADEFAVVNAAETKKISLAELKTALTKDGLSVTGDLSATGEVIANQSRIGPPGPQSNFYNSTMAAVGADATIMQAGVLGATNGFTVRWNHATSTIRANFANLPTSATGLTTGDLWNDGGALKIAP